MSTDMRQLQSPRVWTRLSWVLLLLGCGDAPRMCPVPTVATTCVPTCYAAWILYMKDACGPGGACRHESDDRSDRYCFANGVKEVISKADGRDKVVTRDGRACYETKAEPGGLIVTRHTSPACGDLVITSGAGPSYTVSCDGTSATILSGLLSCDQELATLRGDTSMNPYAGCMEGGCPP